MMKVKIIKGDPMLVGKIFENFNDDKSYYHIQSKIGIILVKKDDAEVVEDEKSCETCGQPRGTEGYCSYDCDITHKYWQPINQTEEIEKKCETCKNNDDGSLQCNLMGIECNNFEKWIPEKETADPSKIVSGREQQDKFKKLYEIHGGITLK